MQKTVRRDYAPLLLVLSALFVAAFTGEGLAADRPDGIKDDARYRQCLHLARTKPEQGHEQARQWEAQGGGDGAMHCTAMSLIGLGHYQDAAERLETLARTLAKGPSELASSTQRQKRLRIDLMAQAGQAWLLADKAQRAQIVLTRALKLAPTDIELYIDRSIARAGRDLLWEAIDDLNRALELNPNRDDVLVLRATAYRQLETMELAAEDVQRALSLRPASPDGLLERGIQRRLANDRAGARQDWLKVLEFEESGPVAEAARLNIERMDVRIEGPPAAAPPAEKAR